MNDIKIEKIDVNCPARPLSEDFQEYFDKLYGRPCTDMYDFEFFTPEECEKEDVNWGMKSKKKENITEDQKIKKQRENYSFSKPLSNNIVTEKVNLADVLNKQMELEIKKEIANEILKRVIK